mmetsp:Transcript_21725/g.30691  ORF Transcript_21725/g.30691 Transcript_21725/m.30691 type:complete len:95 (-) Transcript_21725:26-310(-)
MFLKFGLLLFGAVAAAADEGQCGSDANYAALRSQLTDLIREKNCGPILIRLSWHDAGTFKAADGSGGPRGCMRFSKGESTHGANAGLDVARYGT